MFKFNIALFIMITFLYSLPHPPSATLQWNPNIFGNWTKVKKVHPHKYKIKSNKPIHCRLINQKQRRSFSQENRMISMINQLYSINEMRINGLITKKEYKRAKANTMRNGTGVHSKNPIIWEMLSNYWQPSTKPMDWMNMSIIVWKYHF